jgi:hypothetical protein
VADGLSGPVRQQAGNVASLDNSSCRASLLYPTLQGATIVVIASARVPSGTAAAFTGTPSAAGLSFTGTQKAVLVEDDVAVAVWVKEAAAPITSVTVQNAHLSLQVRVLELTGTAQSSVVDKVVIGSGDSPTFSSGATGTTTQADGVLIGAVVNQYASTRQSAFTGGLSKLSETVTPTSDLDGERHWLTVHAGTTTQTGSFTLGGKLSTGRDWIAVLIALKGASLGPLRATSLAQGPSMTFGGRADLTVFGRLASLQQDTTMTFGGSAWVGPFHDQFLLGGRAGLLIGENTPYRVASVEGLGGADVRQSDTDFPGGDGAQRGTDLQSARLVVFDVNFDGTTAEIEAAMQTLLAAVRPQRDEDWPLLYRLPGMPLRQLWCRPMSTTRRIDGDQRLLSTLQIPLRAADPRIYSAAEREVVVPVTPTATGPVTAVSATNAGTGRAYPVIRMTPEVEVSRVALVNATGDVAFEVEAALAPGAELVGDMPALVTSAPRSVITVDGQPKYGAWQPPREPFYLAPDPGAPDGVNALYLQTTPPGAAVTCVLQYRDTWSG